MPKSHDTGKKGEDLAQKYLAEKGWNIMDRNWRKAPAEIDLIGRDENELVFVEVKSRTDKGFPIEEYGLDEKKMRTVTDAAFAYMQEIEWEGEFRFDIVLVHFDTDGAFSIRHFPDAFFPGLEGF